MGFEKAWATKNEQELATLIDHEFADWDWLDIVSDYCSMLYGGWPEDPSYYVKHVERDEESICVNVEVAWYESRPTSCPEVTLPYDRFTYFQIVITDNGNEIDIDASDHSSDSIEEDFYPMDYQ